MTVFYLIIFLFSITSGSVTGAEQLDCHSAAKHDPKCQLIEQQILKLGGEFNDLMKRLKSGRSYEQLRASGDLAAMDQTLAEEYIYTSRDGKISNKAEDLESYKSNKIKIESADILDHKVRVITADVAIETGAIRYKGLNDGKPFDITKRLTTTWVYRDQRWQIVSDHTSAVTP
jgi:Domain of unknown function (DUF4440)